MSRRKREALEAEAERADSLAAIERAMAVEERDTIR